MRGATGVPLQPPQIVRLPQKIALQNFRANVRNLMKHHFQCGADPTMIRARNRQSATRLAPEVTFRAHHTHICYCKIHHFAPNLTFKPSPSAAPATKSDTIDRHQILRLPRKVTVQLHQVLHLSRKVTLELHQVLRLPRKVTVQLHQVLHLPRKVTLELHHVPRLSRRKAHMLNPHHIWNLIYNAQSNRVPSNLRKYCACHKKLHCKISEQMPETWWNVISNAGPIRPWSEHETVSPQPASHPRFFFSSSPHTFAIVKYNISRPILHSNLHQVPHLPRKVTLDLHQILHLPRKVTLELHQVLHLSRKVRLELHQVLRLPRKVTVQLHQVLHLPRKVILDLHQILHLPRKVTLELHQVLHLSRKVTLELHQVLLLPRKGTVQLHQVLHLPRKVTLELHQVTLELHQVPRRPRKVTLYWMTLLNCDFTELWLYWTVTLLNCDFTELWLYWTVTLLNCYFTELWLYWTVTLLNCDFTSLTLLNCDFTLLNCNFTEMPFVYRKFLNLNFLWLIKSKEALLTFIIHCHSVWAGPKMSKFYLQ